ncbi:c6 zinc finger domain containing protein [Grosmannia clavigera kw1407]|uniref:C6 zinc finger domain containing protein n=1 Tax=Grosmannia clavigera (strain kw1407 / UAMH 11150) TaxID=655863 RepID=F0XL55_GROCL|nr:c6 zinc finger domain containing protein [Grosmannia clavigera kw1407]EFX01579.1 c6 zinc finger domain containing protein [Grosmannia clavigera kw1407]
MGTADLGASHMGGLIGASIPFSVACGSSMIATICIQPIDTVKVRMQLLDKGRGTGAVSVSTVVKDLVARGGVINLYQGLSAGLLRQLVYGTLRLGLFSTFEQQLSRRAREQGTTLGFRGRALAGLGAGAIAAFVGNPTEVALIRMQADGMKPVEQQRNYSSAFNAIWRIAREEGVLGLWKDQPLPLNSTPEHAADENRLYSQEPKIQHGRSSREGDTTMAATTSPEILIPMSASHSIHDTPPASSASHRLPPYIRPLSSQIDSRDMDYLADKGALTILNDEFRDELLRIYVNFVYPFMPAIDVKSFIESIMQGDGSRPVSLLLFQAIMFASVAFVDVRFLKENGFHSRKEARKTFFSRVRLLYGLDCEPDRISLLQAVLLMTYWYESPDDDKDTWYWMGVALTMAQVAGLHRNPESLRIPIEEKRLRRRLWWSCVMRDKLLALGIRRPARTLSNKFDVPILAFDDFDLSAPSEPLCRLLGESSLVLPENEGREVLAGMIVELSKLCVCLGHILRSQYTVMGSHPAGSEYLLKALVVPEKSEHQALELAACDKELTDWLQSQDSRYSSERFTQATCC